MNFSNNSYRSPSSRPPSTYPPQNTSTPSNSRFILSRFGYSSIPSYPRPRSSASKPNPDSDLDFPMDNERSMYDFRDDFNSPRSLYGNNNNITINSNANMDSMRNNFGSPDVPMGNSSYLPGDNAYVNRDSYLSSNSYESPNSSLYYTCNSSFSDSTKFSPQVSTPMYSGLNLPVPSNSDVSLLKQQNSVYGTSNMNTSHFQNKTNQNSKPNSTGKAKAFFSKKKNLLKKKMASKSEWRCAVCSIDFTSSIPYEMHLRGARHAKKLKTQDVYQSIQKQVALSKDIAPVGNTFRCEMCNVHANSSLQFQTHLDGTKHKNKLLQLNQAQEKKEEQKTEAEVEASQVNGKTNGSTVRSLPSDFGEPQPSKLAKFSCDTCNVIVNSETQLQQHLASKKHQNKVEGKPLPKKKQKKEETKEAMEEDAPASSEEAPEPAQVESKTVMGVKTLSSSFIAGETLQ